MQRNPPIANPSPELGVGINSSQQTPVSARSKWPGDPHRIRALAQQMLIRAPKQCSTGTLLSFSQFDHRAVPIAQDGADCLDEGDSYQDLDGHVVELPLDEGSHAPQLLLTLPPSWRSQVGHRQIADKAVQVPAGSGTTSVNVTTGYKPVAWIRTL